MSQMAGFVYDVTTTQHKDPDNDNHVENPARITHVYQNLAENKLLDKMIHLPARMASDDELNLTHTKSYIETVKSYTNSTHLHCDIPETYPTYVCDETYETAAAAVGACLNLADGILTNKVKNGFALTRPPGHHAGKDKSEGFCFFNNVAITARYLQTNYPERVKKIAIFDWDVHHGNGTQEEFYGDNDVLYISNHRYDDGRFYPSLPGGDANHVGCGKGEGYTVNVPWSGDLMGNEEYLATFHTTVKPIIRCFQPDVILVSAGFDAADGDPLGEYSVQPEVFGHMVQNLMELANGRVMLVLEGGYDVRSLTECVKACIEALIGPPKYPTLQPMAWTLDSIKYNARLTLTEVMRIQSKFWPLKICNSTETQS